MRFDLDPKKTWNDEVSPTTAAAQAASAVSRSAKHRRFKAQKVAEETTNVDEEDQTSKATSNENEKLAAPLPWPSSHSPTLQESHILDDRRRDLRSPLHRIDTNVPSSSVYGPQPPSFSIEAALDNHIASLGEEFTTKTPTPTSADFHEMLGTYIAEPDEVDRLVEMADRLSDHRVMVARAEERRKMMASPLLTPAQRDSFLGKDADVPTAVVSSFPANILPAATLTSATSPPPVSRALDANGLPSASLTTPGAFRTPGSITSRYSLVPHTPAAATAKSIHTTALRLRILLRLYPAKLLLSQTITHTDCLPTVAQAREAARHAYLALSHARSAFVAAGQSSEDGDASEVREGAALLGRCAYYVGVSEWVLGEWRRIGREEDGVDVGWREEEDEVPVLEYFEMAVGVKEGGCAQGRWAEEWVAYLKGEVVGAVEAKGVNTSEDREEGQTGRRESRGWLGWISNVRNPFRQSITSEKEVTARTASRTVARERGGYFSSLSDADFVHDPEAPVNDDTVSPASARDETEDSNSPDRTDTTISSFPRTPELRGDDDPTSPVTAPNTSASSPTRPRSHNVKRGEGNLPELKPAGERLGREGRSILSIMMETGEEV